VISFGGAGETFSKVPLHFIFQEKRLSPLIAQNLAHFLGENVGDALNAVDIGVHLVCGNVLHAV
jgi:hypothetical protein